MYPKFELVDRRVVGRSRFNWLPPAIALMLVVIAAAVVTVRFGAANEGGTVSVEVDEATTLRATSIADPVARSSGPTDEAGPTPRSDEALLLAALRGELETAIGDAYAGVWLGEGQALTIGATNNEAADVAESMGVVAEVVEYSAADLDATMDALNAGASELTGVSTGWYVDLKANRVAVETKDQDASATAIAGMGIDVAMITFVAEVERVVSSALPTVEYWGTAKGSCSFGFGVTGGFITADHCIPEGSTDPVDLTDSVKGRVVPDRRKGEVRRDIAFVAVDAPYFVGPEVPDGSGGSTTVLGSEEAPVGASVCKYGRTSGWTCGTITSRNQTIHTNAGTYFGQISTTVCTVFGDSGGRLMWGNQAQGVTSTGGSCTDGPGNGTFQPIQPLLEEWNLTLTVGTPALPGSDAPPPAPGDPAAPALPAPGAPAPAPAPAGNPAVPVLPAPGAPAPAPGVDPNIPVLPGVPGESPTPAPAGNPAVPVLPAPGAPAPAPAGDPNVPVLPAPGAPAPAPGVDPNVPALPAPGAPAPNPAVPVLPAPGAPAPAPLPSPTPAAPALPAPGAPAPTPAVPVLPAPGAPSPNPAVPVLPPPAPPVTAAPAPTTTAPSNLPSPLGSNDPFLFSSFIPESDCVSLSGSNVVLFRGGCRPADHQLLTLEAHSNGSGFLIKGNQTNLCWTVDGSSNVVMSTCSNAPGQSFFFLTGVYGIQILAATDGRCVEIQGGPAGSNIALGSCGSRLSHQSWGTYHYPD